MLIHHDRYRVAGMARHFAVHEEILQLLVAVQSDRSKSVARTTISYAQNLTAQVAANGSDRSISHDCTAADGKRIGMPHVGRDHAANAGQGDVSWDGQRTPEKVR